MKTPLKLSVFKNPLTHRNQRAKYFLKDGIIAECHIWKDYIQKWTKNNLTLMMVDISSELPLKCLSREVRHIKKRSIHTRCHDYFGGNC